jgi:Family of unknown function (DUF6688)
MIILFVFSILLIIVLVIRPFFESLYHFIKFHEPSNSITENEVIAKEQEVSTMTSNEEFANHSNLKIDKRYSEVLFMGIAPVMGLGLVYGFQEIFTPFNLSYFPSLAVFLLIPYLSYWISKSYFKELPLEANLLLSYGMMTGCLIYPFLAIHFVSEMTLLGTVIFPFLAFPLFAPIPALLYTLKQFHIHTSFLERQINETEINHLNQNAIQWIGNLCKFENPAAWLGLSIFILIIQNLLGFFGQPFNAVVLAFLQSEDFFFSTAQNGIF